MCNKSVARDFCYKKFAGEAGGDETDNTIL